MDEKEKYKEEIIKMVGEIENVKFLAIIYSFVKEILKKCKK